MRKKERSVTELVFMDDEDDKISSKQHPSAGRPNAYFARIREEQEEELEQQESGDTFGGAFRGTRPAPKGGAATVRPTEVKGAEELCWCGRPLGHDWPGKNVGAKHPAVKEGSMSNLEVETPDRRVLRAYHRRLQDFIISCIKDDGLKFRMTKNSIILYPPDDSTPITVYARNTDRQVRQLQKWYTDHVYVEPKEDEVTPEVLAELAKAKNDPAEHPVEERPHSKDPQYQETPADPKDYMPEPEPEPTTAPVRSNDDDWTWYATDEGKVSDHIQTNGERFRCLACLNTDHPLDTDSRRSIGGHNRMWHTDRSTIHGPEARGRAVETGRYNKTRDRMIETLVPLLESVGWEPEAKPDPEHDKQMKAISKHVAKLEADLAEAVKRAEEAEARLALLREALNA